MVSSVLIIEDEAPAYRRLNTLISEKHRDLQVVEVIDAVAEATKWFRNHAMPDLIFSDIQLADGLSFEIFTEVKPTCPIIFTTAYDEYMLDAFRSNGIDYLLKPIQEADLARSIAKYRSFAGMGRLSPNIDEIIKALKPQGKKYKERFLVKLGTRLMPVPVGDIAYFQSSEGSSEIVTRQGKRLIIDQPLDELESELNPEIFYRLNRQMLCHIDSIESIHQYFKGKLKIMLRPHPDNDVLVSREKARAFKEWMDGEV